MESAEYEIKLRDSFTAGLGRIEGKLNQFESKLGGFGSTLAGVFGGITLAGAVSKGLSFISDTASAIVGLGAEMEQTKISFETMLGSAEKAGKMISNLQDFAKITPFSQKDVIAGAKSLLAYGFEANDLTKQLTTLGDVSAGLSIPIGDLIYLYGTLKTQGKAMSKDLMQFAGRGIPIYKELGKVLGVSTSEVSDLVSKGKVGFEQVQKAFENMTMKGSMFGGLMEKQSQSLSGKWSTLKDTIEIMGTKIGEKLIPFLNKVLDITSSIVNIIPKLDFSYITDVFSDLFSAATDLFDIFKEMFHVVGVNITLLEVFQFIIKGIGFGFRVMTIAISSFVTGFKVLIQAIKDSYQIWEGLSDIIKGVFNMDTTLMYGGINKIKNGFSDIYSHASKTIGAFAEKQGNAYGKFFKSTDLMAGGIGRKSYGAPNNQSSISGGGLSSLKKSSSIGVERIQSGTRNVIVNITKLIESVHFEKGYKESEAKLQGMISKALLASVNDVNIVPQ